MSEPNTVAEPEMEDIVPKSFFARLGNVYLSPGEAFEEINRAPKFMAPIIVLIIVSMISGYFTAGLLDLGSMLAGQMQQAGAAQGPTPEQMQAIIKYAAPIALTLFSPISSFIFVVIVAGFFKLCSVIATKENTFKKLFLVTVYVIAAVTIIQTVVIALTYFLKGPGTVNVANMGSVIASSLGAILANLFGNDVLPKFVMGLAQRIEFFSIWMIVLLAIGYSRVTKKMKTATAATWLGIAYGIIAIVSAAFRAIAG